MSRVSGKQGSSGEKALKPWEHVACGNEGPGVGLVWGTQEDPSNGSGVALFELLDLVKQVTEGERSHSTGSLLGGGGQERLPGGGGPGAALPCRCASTTLWRCAADSQPTPSFTASSVAPRSRRSSPPSITTCAWSSSPTTLSPKRASRPTSSQVTLTAQLQFHSPASCCCILLSPGPLLPEARSVHCSPTSPPPPGQPLCPEPYYS